MSTKKIMLVVGAVLAAIVLAIFCSGMLETVQGGEIHVKQAFITGTLSVKSSEGLYTQGFGKITKYFRTYETYLSKDNLDGVKDNQDAISVRFSDGGKANLSSVTQWRLPLDETQMMKIHRNFRSFDSVSAQVRQWIIEVEKQSSSLLKADETYSTRRGEYAQLMTDQIVNGIYETTTEEVVQKTNEKDEAGKPVVSTTTRVIIKRDADGKPVISKPGIFKEYGIELVNHNLKDIDYDESIEKLIAQKKEAEQLKAVAITNAEKAKQDAITVEAQGQARIAQARADQEVEKITEVTKAQKEKEVAILGAEQSLEVANLNKKQAQAEAESNLVKQRAEAEANRLKVAAGLTPQEAAEYRMKTADLVSKNLSSLKLPEMMIFGGGEGSPMNPFDAVGLESFMKISDKLSGNK